jgi:hypothetical protein
MDFHPSYSQLLNAFHSERVRFLLVGGYALAMHGYVRHTIDLDLWVEPTERNARAIEQACDSCGVILPPVARSNLRSPSQLIRIGVPPVVIDLLTGISGLDFELCHPRRLIKRVGGIEIPTLCLSDLRTGKKASGRLQDLADLEKLPEA